MSSFYEDYSYPSIINAIGTTKGGEKGQAITDNRIFFLVFSLPFIHSYVHAHSFCLFLACFALTYKLHVMCFSSIPSKNTYYFGVTFFQNLQLLTKMHLLNVSIGPCLFVVRTTDSFRNFISIPFLRVFPFLISL